MKLLSNGKKEVRWIDHGWGELFWQWKIGFCIHLNSAGLFYLHMGLLGWNLKVCLFCTVRWTPDLNNDTGLTSFWWFDLQDSKFFRHITCWRAVVRKTKEESELEPEYGRDILRFLLIFKDSWSSCLVYCKNDLCVDDHYRTLSPQGY